MTLAVNSHQNAAEVIIQSLNLLCQYPTPAPEISQIEPWVEGSEKSEVITTVNSVEIVVVYCVYFTAAVCRYTLLVTLLPSTYTHSCFCGLSLNSTNL